MKICCYKTNRLSFLRLPRRHNQFIKNALCWTAWRQEWIRGGDYFWQNMETRHAGKLRTYTKTKSQYLCLHEEMLRTSSHIRTLDNRACRGRIYYHAQNGRNHQTQPRANAIYTKDFSEPARTKAVIITAQKVKI